MLHTDAALAQLCVSALHRLLMRGQAEEGGAESKKGEKKGIKLHFLKTENKQRDLKSNAG